jgi:hypothetical protein
MGDAPRGISSNSIKSNHSGISSIRDVSRIQANEYNEKVNLKRAQTLKQETPAVDRVIEEGSDFDDSGSGFASDTPVAGKKRTGGKSGDVDTFGEAIMRKKKEIPYEESYKKLSASHSHVKVQASAAGSVYYESNKKRAMISQVYPGMTKPKNKNYPTVRANQFP